MHKRISEDALSGVAEKIKTLIASEKAEANRKQAHHVQEMLYAFRTGCEFTQTGKAYGEKVIPQLAKKVGIADATAYNYTYLYRGAGYESQIEKNPSVTREMWQICGMTIAPAKDSFFGCFVLGMVRSKVSELTKDELKQIGDLVRDARNYQSKSLKRLDPRMAEIDENNNVVFRFRLKGDKALPERIRSFLALEQEHQRLCGDINNVLGRSLFSNTEWDNPLRNVWEKHQGKVASKYSPLSPNLKDAVAIKRERNRQRHKLPSRSTEATKNVLLHGDCLKLIGPLEDDSVDVVLTDPPYSKEVYLPWRKVSEKNHDAESDLPKQVEVIANAIKAVKPKLRKRACLFIFFPMDASDFLLQRLRSVFKPSDEVVWQLLVWDKQITPKIGGHQKFSRQCEAILYCNIGNRPLNVMNGKTLFGNIFAHPFTKTDKRYGSWKPIDLLKQLIELTTDKGDVVLDCFAGVGSTGVACNELGRSSILIEKNKYQFAKAQSNLPDSAEKLTPKSV